MTLRPDDRFRCPCCGGPTQPPGADGGRTTRRVLNAIVAERRRQDAKWGEQNHAPEVWLAILAEEVGEVAQAILALRFGAKDHGGEKGSTRDQYRSELVQVASVAVAAIESLDRAKL